MHSANCQITIDGSTYKFSEKGPLIHSVLSFESPILENKEHSVVLKTLDTEWIFFDAIDIDETGELKPYNSNPAQVIVAPTSLIATYGDSKVSLSWTAVSGAIGYNVKRAANAGGSYTTIASNITNNNYVDNTVVEGITYYYVVTAISESANSNEASATSIK
jgi:hypothetical protein